MSDANRVKREHLLWVPVDEPGIEDVHVKQHAHGITITSMLIRLWQGAPMHVAYELECDVHWHTRELRMAAESESGGARTLRLLADGTGNWQDGAGQPLDALQGCIDVDIMITPLTNTLPIRRLALAQGQSLEMSVVYITAPDLDMTPFQQRYTRLDDADGYQHYRYESLESGYTTVLPIDDDGFVVEYPSVWRRVWPTT